MGAIKCCLIKLFENQGLRKVGGVDSVYYYYLYVALACSHCTSVSTDSCL